MAPLVESIHVILSTTGSSLLALGYSDFHEFFRKTAVEMREALAQSIINASCEESSDVSLKTISQQTENVPPSAQYTLAQLIQHFPGFQDKMSVIVPPPSSAEYEKFYDDSETTEIDEAIEEEDEDEEEEEEEAVNN